MKARSTKPDSFTYLPALPGTKLVYFYYDYFGADADDPAQIVEKIELPVVAWEMHRGDYGPHAYPVCTRLTPAGDDVFNWAIVHPDGAVECRSVYGDFEGKTLEELETFSEHEAREIILNDRCMDCGADLREAAVWGVDAESPILVEEVWQGIVPGGEGKLCREHIEARLGRPLTAADCKVKPERHVH